MTAFGVVYPQFEVRNPIEVKETFHTHLSLLKQTFYASYS